MTDPSISNSSISEDIIMVSDGEGDAVDTTPPARQVATTTDSPPDGSQGSGHPNSTAHGEDEVVQGRPGDVLGVGAPKANSLVAGGRYPTPEETITLSDSDDDIVVDNVIPPSCPVKAETDTTGEDGNLLNIHTNRRTSPKVGVFVSEVPAGDEENTTMTANEDGMSIDEVGQDSDTSVDVLVVDDDDLESTDDESSAVVHVDRRPDRTCSHCQHVFKKPSKLKAHLQARTKNGTCRIQRIVSHYCPHCSKSFTRKTGLNQHLTARGVRGGCTGSRGGRVPKEKDVECGECHAMFGSLKYLQEHANKEHDLNAEIGEKTFKSMTECDEWLDHITYTEHFMWVKAEGQKPNSKTKLYLCSRSGVYVDKSTEERNRQKKGTRKIDAHCTSFCRTVEHSSTHITAEYCLQHLGHGIDLCHLPQYKPMRVRMQELHKDGTSLDQILKICRDEFPNSMVKMSDVFNTIYRGRGDDLTEVMRMVGESMDAGSTDFFVTPEERESGEYTQIGIQTEEMKKKYIELTGENVVMDSTACVSRYDHVLVALVCVDKMNCGHVVAFLIVKGESEDAMKDLMFELRKRCGQAKPRIFASDAAPALFNVWKLVNGFEEWQCRLVCQWHALRALGKAVHAVGKDGKKKVAPVDPTHDGEALRKQVMELLVQMSKTKDQEDCLVAERLLLQYLGEGSVEFRTYLRVRYLERKEQWTRAFRDCGDRYVSMVTSMHIEATFRVIKHVYLKGIANRRLDVLIWNLLQFAADRAQRTATNIARPAYVKLENAISKKHRVNARPYFENQGMIEQMSATHWKVKSSTEKTVYMRYNVHLVNTGSCKCQTSPICQQLLSKAAIGDRLQGVRDKDLPRCGLCDCRYECSCEDWRFRSRSCKHMHAVHSIFYTIPAAMGDMPTVWLTGIASDLVNDPDNNDTLAPIELTAEHHTEQIVVEDVAGPSTSGEPSRAERSNTLLMKMSAMVSKRCKRLMDQELTDEQFEKIESAMERDDEMFTGIGIEMGLSSWAINPEMPKRQQQAARHSHNMGRLHMKKRETKKQRKI